MPAYFIAIRESVNDPMEMEIYAKKARVSLLDVSMIPRAVYGKVKALEGNAPQGVVVAEFPSVEDAEAWYFSPAYQEALPHRLRGATYRTFITEGI